MTHYDTYGLETDLVAHIKVRRDSLTGLHPNIGIMINISRTNVNHLIASRLTWKTKRLMVTEYGLEQ